MLEINVFQFIHLENKEKLNLITSLWGSECDPASVDKTDQRISAESLSIFEKVFMKTLNYYSQEEKGEQIDDKLCFETISKGYEIILFEIERYTNFLQRKQGFEYDKFMNIEKTKSVISQKMEAKNFNEVEKLAQELKEEEGILEVSTDFSPT
mmetsp:Transcript_30060/g.29301  ORF Transcript_30060/g.29301 Transcript_30060/m.29301 type:complete len:153 (+) Transcript_30060:942-1400(+)|eukprot:CAMPEP_0170551478 /NCGR_PEP_ID=MMETSP0211-20121228/9469_1 /TAXON_ID=311385 /ORGANISM="Pseudokeronopsis sp., Strain OXSARD2" /LENGTH=152 /DNA_ID=CAMNT_0010858659 /DNA_START=900 /DNA_END=1358 /DNA_ORIENTATION=+